ncbi:MAG: hypothetical protein ACK41O_27350, partial [Runella zeae]
MEDEIIRIGSHFIKQRIDILDEDRLTEGDALDVSCCPSFVLLSLSSSIHLFLHSSSTDSASWKTCMRAKRGSTKQNARSLIATWRRTIIVAMS